MPDIKIKVGNRIVGVVRGDTFIKKVRSTVHFLRTPPAIAFDAESLNDAEKAGAVYVLIIDKDDANKEYHTTMKTIRNHGFVVERGFGIQWCLALKYWASIIPDTQPELF